MTRGTTKMVNGSLKIVKNSIGMILVITTLCARLLPPSSNIPKASMVNIWLISVGAALRVRYLLRTEALARGVVTCRFCVQSSVKVLPSTMERSSLLVGAGSAALWSLLPRESSQASAFRTVPTTPTRTAHKPYFNASRLRCTGTAGLYLPAKSRNGRGINPDVALRRVGAAAGAGIADRRCRRRSGAMQCCGFRSVRRSRPI